MGSGFSKGRSLSAMFRAYPSAGRAGNVNSRESGFEVAETMLDFLEEG